MSGCPERWTLLALLAIAPVLGAQPAQETQLREAARLRSVALAEMEAGNYGRAALSLRRLEQLLPDNVLPKLNLAICQLKLGRDAAALAAIGQARELAPDNPRVLDTLARILELDPEHTSLRYEILRHFAAVHPDDPRPWYHEAQTLEREKRWAEAIPKLRRALERAPENLVVLGDLLVAAGGAGDLAAVGDTLDAIEDRLDGFEGNLATYAGWLRGLLGASKTDGLAPATVVVRNLLRPLELYQQHLITFQGSRQSGGGGLFPQLDFDPPLPASIQGGRDVPIRFEDATAALGFDPRARAKESLLLVTRDPEREGLLTEGPAGLRRWDLEAGRLLARELTVALAAGSAAFTWDVDQDGLSDLVAAGARSGVRWFPGRADGTFGPPLLVLAPEVEVEVAGVFPLELDHDGDLDLLVARAGRDLYLQNNGDGSWSERTADLGIGGPEEPTDDVALADFDDDGDLDLLVVHAQSHPRLYLNRRAGMLVDATARTGLERGAPGAAAVRVADFDADGRFDLLLWNPTTVPVLLLARGETFLPQPLPAAVAWSAAAVGDFDNDGDTDAIAAPREPAELTLWRNRGGRLEPEPLGLAAAGWVELLPGDFDADGDLDLAARLADGERRLLRNQGGELNQWLRLSLRGKNDNNAKNNVQGLYTRIEARAGQDFQVVLGNGGVNHLGLGAHRQADVVRVVWTNGLVQTWQMLASGQTLVEEQVLKGSCPFLYAWNGEEFGFVTDLMWKSPLGMILPDGSPAPHASARDFVRVPGEALVPAGGELWLQVTEELWETAYVDRQRLIAIDHPAELELVVDEKFTPPPHAEAPALHWLGAKLEPSAARDQQGRDVLAEIRARDEVYVDALPLARYQGTTDGHALELVFRDVPAGERLRLVLLGWIFPSDSSINRALAQDSGRDAAPPRLELWDGEGWREIVPWLGFPAGKRKAVVTDLTGLVPAGELRLRIPTSMQIYWDAAVLAVGDEHPQAAITELAASRADLHYRGYSKLVRASASSPHLYDYRDVSVGPRFRDLAGFYTRYGEVGELLAGSDDRYVVMNAGDELTVVYDATALPSLPAGWRRDWVLATDGWVKDGDLNTTASETVEPLPYHGMTSYPDQPEHRYPDDPEHREYLERYQTRRVGRDSGDARPVTSAPIRRRKE